MVQRHAQHEAALGRALAEDDLFLEQVDPTLLWPHRIDDCVRNLRRCGDVGVP